MNTKIEKRLKYLKFLFSYDKNFNIDINSINLLYFKIPEWCCEYKPLPLLLNIGPFEWNKMTKMLVDIYDSKNEYNSSFYNKIKEYGEKTLNIEIDDLMGNEMMLNYIKCRPNIKILTQFSNITISVDNIHLYATKKIILNKKAVECLIYQLFSLTDKFKSYSEIQKFVELLDTVEDKYYINIYVFEYKTNNKLDIDITTDFISNNFIDAIMHGEIYFNNNSIEFLKEMLLERFLLKEFDRSRLLINTFKKILMMRHINLLQQSKFMLLAGTVLSIYGIRKGTDLDMMISNLPESNDDNIISKISDIFFKENKKLFFIDAYHPKVRWSQFWNEWHKEWASFFGAGTMLECIHNPQFHFYFCGVKFLILQAEIERRLHRGRPASIVDIIMCNRLLNKNIILKPIPKESNKDNVITITNPKTFIKVVKYWLKKKYDTKISSEELKQIKFL